jgi:hypothetical protein
MLSVILLEIKVVGWLLQASFVYIVQEDWVKNIADSVRTLCFDPRGVTPCYLHFCSLIISFTVNTVMFHTVLVVLVKLATVLLVKFSLAIFSLLSRNGSRLMRWPCCLCVCVFVSHQFLNRLVDFNEIWYGGDAVEGDREAVIFNPIAWTILKCLTRRQHWSSYQPFSIFGK